MGRSLFLALLLGVISPVRGEAPPSTLRFEFRDSGVAAYQIEASAAARADRDEWIEARGSATHQRVEISRRIVVQADGPEDLQRLISGASLTVIRLVSTNLYILEAPNALTAAREAHRISMLGKTSVPVMRRDIVLHGLYTYQPNDRYFNYTWHLEQAQGTNAGMDLRVRAAWPYTQGQGVIIGFADDGVEYTHPELVHRAAGMPHHSFVGTNHNGMPDSSADKHGTAVAGLAVAELNNGLGAAGVAPKAGLASWKILNPAASDEQLMNLYLYENESVWVQNHSWGYNTGVQLTPGVLEKLGIAKALESARGGRGIVMVRSAGNERATWGNANDSAYLTDPGIIAAGSVRSDGRAASYSVPGANLLVVAPSGDPTGWVSLFTTDRQGLAGYNNINWYGDTNLSDYCFSTGNAGNYSGTGFSGTSGSAPQISGAAALVLSANTNLSRRDVQQILLLSSRHFDFADPDVTTNGAGLRVSHNVGFGVPDLGLAVRMALKWPSRPALTNVTTVAADISSNTPAVIPDDGRLVLIYNGANQLQSIAASPSLGIQVDSDTDTIPLVDVGPAFAPIEQDLTGKAALIKRGTNDFIQKITYAAQAGAVFAVVYNHSAGDRIIMGSTDFAPIPAVFITKVDGDALQAALAQTNLQARMVLQAARHDFLVTNTLSCEHVSVRLNIQHPRRGDILITLISPKGTRSVLGRLNADTNSCRDWTYTSTHHFYESSFGTWSLAVSDEAPGATGSIQSASLTLYGVEMVDSDHDGLDDRWEMAHFGTLAYGPTDDPDGDGFSNLREQIMGTDPNASDSELRLDFSKYDASQARLSWPSVEQHAYEVLSGSDLSALTSWTNVQGRFSESDLLIPATNTARFFEIRTKK